MSDETGISWTDHTFDPWMGCQKVSRGCKHCYAARETMRYGRDVFGSPSKRQRTSEGNCRKPLAWDRSAAAERTPARTFCASWADIFEDARGPNEWRPDFWKLVRQTSWLDWQLLTKRRENFARMLPDDWGNGWPWVWLGPSVEDNSFAVRASVLVQAPAWVHFVSYEPATGLGDEIQLDDVEWVICGGESGPGHESMDLAWAQDLRTRCDVAGVAFFLTQVSGPRSGTGTDALGEIIRHYPRSWDRARAQVELRR